MRRVSLAPWMAAGVLVLALGGCKSEPKSQTPKGAASASPKPPVVECSLDPSGSILTIAPEQDSARPEDNELDLPFAVEIGMATGYPEGFVVGALKETRDGTHAVLGLVRTAGETSQVVDLMRVHGVAVPPQIAVVGKRAILAIADGDAQGVLARLASVDLSAPRLGPTFGGLVPLGSDESSAYGILAEGERALLYWDEWPEKKRYGVVRVVRVAVGDLKTAGEPLTISAEGQDADGPRLLLRPGGYWAAWISHGAEQDDQESGPQWITIRPLDTNGAPAGQPIDVSPRDAFSLSFDLAPAPDGGLLVAWREDRHSVATAGGQLRLARVSASGSVERLPVIGDRIGAAPPMLLVSNDSRPAGWLAIGNPADDAMVAALEADGRVVTQLTPVPSLERRVLLARHDDRILAVAQRGRRAELQTVSCRTDTEGQ